MQTKFNVGDKVWVKNLVTNEPILTYIKSVHPVDFGTSACVLYITEEGPYMNIDGKVSPSNVFASEEECNATERYYPKSGPVYVGNYTEKDWENLKKKRNNG